MVLERIENPRVNIKDLSLNEPVKSLNLFFDPDKELTEKHWSKFIEDKLHLFTVESTSTLVHLKELFPEKVDALNLGEEVWNEFKKEITDWSDLFSPNNNMGQSGFFLAVEEMRNTLLLFPEKKEEINSLYQKLKEKTGQMEIPSKADLQSGLDTCADFAVVAPWELSILDKETIDYWKEGFGDSLINWHQIDWNNIIETRKVAQYAQNMADLRIAFPEVKKEQRPDRWKIMRQLLKEYENTNQLRSFCQFAYNMKILSADEVRVVNQDIKLIMPKHEESLVTSTPTLPEIRRF